MTFGTSSFVSRAAALKYYKPYGTDAAEVTRKEQDGEISYGRPTLKPGESLTVREGRYHITSPG